MKRARVWLMVGLASLSAAGCTTLSPEEDPVQIKINDLDNRLTRIERVVANQSLLQLSNDLEAMRADLKSMRNEVDQLNNAVEASRKQQRDLYADLDTRMKVLETRGGVTPATSPGPGAMAPDGAAVAPVPAATAAAAVPATGDAAAGDGTDKGDYQAAFNQLKNSQYDRAIGSFRKFLATYPQSPLAENAQYWLGEAYYVTKAYPDALQSFHQVSEKYPQSRKLADALLKTGYCYYEMKQWANAREVLTQVAEQYPDASAGRLAKQRLDKMASEKH
jgi:tol-pal system protein YbgF